MSEWHIIYHLMKGRGLTLCVAGLLFFYFAVDAAITAAEAAAAETTAADAAAEAIVAETAADAAGNPAVPRINTCADRNLQRENRSVAFLSGDIQRFNPILRFENKSVFSSSP